MGETCKTCRWWNAHSQDERLGDCMSDRRYWRVKSQISGTSGGTSWIGHAVLDSFGRDETRPDDSCGKHERGDDLPPFEHHPQPERLL